MDESWTIKNGEWWRIDGFQLTVVLDKTLESPLDCKEIKPVNPKRNQSWIFIGRTHTEAEAPIFWLPDVKNWLIWKDPDARKDWRQEKKGMMEDEMVRCHHWFDGHEFEQVLGFGGGQGSLVCCNSWGHKEFDTTEQLNWTGERQGWETDALVLVLSLPCWPWGVLGERLSSLQLLLTKYDPESVILSPQSFRDYITRLSLRPGATGSIQRKPEHGLGPSCGGRWKQGSV